MKGKVKWYNIKQGYGFIKGDDGEDAFIHKTEIPFWSIFLKRGDKVEYKKENTIKGKKATKIKVL
jgi:CspA family cold shock protein